MKRLAIVLLFALGITQGAHSQSIRSANLYQKYRGEKGVVAVYIPGFVMKFAASIADLDGPEKQMVKSLQSLRVLTIEDHTRFSNVNFVKELKLHSIKGKFTPLLEVHDGGEDVMILGKEKKGKLKDLLIVVGGEDNVLVHIRGRMNADMLSSIADIADIDELRYTRQL
jgi:hypothetical protein